MNLRFYNKMRAVPEEALKAITGGRLKGFSDINPMWRIKALTETFGPCGFGWWYEITDKRLVPDEGSGQVAAFMDVLLYVKDPETGEVSHGIPGTGGSSFVEKENKGMYMSDECFKMALTDAISVAAKALGVAADVYFSNDRSKYTTLPPEAPEAAKTFFCSDCGVELEDVTLKSGTFISAEEFAYTTEQEFGRCLCRSCRRIAKRAAEEA